MYLSNIVKSYIIHLHISEIYVIHGKVHVYVFINIVVNFLISSILLTK